jgi:hypothetical protein
MSLNIVELMANPNAMVFIHKNGGDRQTIEGFITEDISISSSADWQSPMDTVGGAMKTVQSLMNLAGASFNEIADGIGLGMIGQKALRAYATTVVDYMGTNKPSFTLPLVFPALTISDDPRAKIVKLLECVYPSVELETGFGKHREHKTAICATGTSGGVGLA